MRLDDRSTWREFFDSFQYSAWRLEVRPRYVMPEEDEEFQEFMRNGHLSIPNDDQWLTRVRHFKATNRTIGRVHALRRPLNRYLHYEFEVYRHTVAAGEDIRILDLTEHPNLDLPVEDFWLFDDAKIVRMMYRDDGTQIGRELLDSPDIDRYRRYRDLTLRYAVPFAEYQAWSSTLNS